MPQERTTVTFKSSAFNTTEPKEHFINPCCFGDDLARWMIQALYDRGIDAEEEPGQEDFGWYLRFKLQGQEYCFVLGFRPGDENEEGDWIGELERDCGFIASLFGGRKRNIRPEAAEAIHVILSDSAEIWDLRWHRRADLDTGREEQGSLQP
ncbi:MAG: hypothetical protein KY468_12890 [Armatimonadetes bacterium]|nr:hypothetical protein [Armatimonadota bacterium]